MGGSWRLLAAWDIACTNKGKITGCQIFFQGAYLAGTGLDWTPMGSPRPSTSWQPEIWPQVQNEMHRMRFMTDLRMSVDSSDVQGDTCSAKCGHEESIVRPRRAKKAAQEQRYFDYWLVVYLPLWKIWKSIGMIIPNIWKNKSHVPNHQPGLVSEQKCEIDPFV